MIEKDPNINKLVTRHFKLINSAFQSSNKILKIEFKKIDLTHLKMHSEITEIEKGLMLLFNEVCYAYQAVLNAKKNSYLPRFFHHTESVEYFSKIDKAAGKINHAFVQIKKICNPSMKSEIHDTGSAFDDYSSMMK